MPKKSLLKSSKKKIIAKIFLPKKFLKLKISNPQKSFDYPCHLKFGVPAPGNSSYKKF